jgi:hypothetical protein
MRKMAGRDASYAPKLMAFEEPEGIRRMREVQEQSERIRQMMAEPEGLRRMRELQEQSERIRQMMAEPEGLRRMRELQEQSERIRQMMAEPEGLRRMRELQEQSERIRQMTGPAGRDVLTSQLRALTQPDFIASLRLSSLSDEDDRTLSKLPEAMSTWVAEAGAVPMVPSFEPTSDEFAWVELLPSVAQLKLLNSTLDILNGLLLLIAYLAPESAPPMPMLLTIEVLLRLVRFLFVRLDSN